MPKVSVVIASYQHARFVRQTIESVLGQTFQDFEIVVTDDGSRDGTPEVIRTFTDPRIKLEVFRENRGACIAMNAAIARATGAYVAVLNSDDYWLPGKLARQVEVLDSRPGLAAVFALPMIVDERGAPLPGHPLNQVFEARTESRQWWLSHFFYKSNSLCHPTLVIRRECYAALGGYDARLAQVPDFDMWIRLASKYEFDVLAERTTAFRILDNEANASAPSPDVNACTMWELEKVLHRYLALSDVDFRQVFADDLARLRLSDTPQDVALARIATTVAQPSHQRFGLDLLYDAAGRGSSHVTPREIAVLAKLVDPHNMRGRERLTTRARPWRAVALLRSMRKALLPKRTSPI